MAAVRNRPGQGIGQIIMPAFGIVTARVGSVADFVSILPWSGATGITTGDVSHPLNQAGWCVRYIGLSLLVTDAHPERFAVVICARQFPSESAVFPSERRRLTDRRRERPGKMSCNIRSRQPA